MSRRGGCTIVAATGLGWILALSGTWVPALAGDPSPSSDLVERGRSLYRIYCMSCHGESAKGSGSAAAGTRTPPPDLTVIARANGGTFPFDRVYRTIAGIDELHAGREMPLWGFAFQELDKDTDQSDEVRGRILQLIHYLRSIQVEPERPRERRP